MKKILLTFLSVLFVTAMLSSQVLLGWEMTNADNGGQTPGGSNNFGTSPFNPTTTAANVTTSGFERGSGVGTTGTGAANAFGGNAFDVATAASAIADNKFFTFTINITAAQDFSLSSFSAFNLRRSSTGPTQLLIQYSLDGTNFTDITLINPIGSTTTAAGNAQGTIDLSTFTALQNITLGTTVTFRFVPFGASGATGTFYFNNAGTGEDFQLNGAVVLPIELSYFNATATANNQVALAWGTASEENNDYMAVERSQDGQKFFEIGRVKGAGTTVEAQAYSFIDAAPKAGVNYYRLRQVDFDGTVEYHKVVAVTVKGAAGVTVYPTLVNSELNVVLEGTANISVMNITGQVVKQVKGADFTTIDVAELATGTYFLMIESNNAVEAVRFVKQ